MSENIKQYAYEWGKITIWGMLPVFLTFIIIMSAIIIKVTQREEITPLTELQRKRKSYKTQKLFWEVDYVNAVYMGIGITLVMISLLLIFNIIFEGYIYRMMENIQELSSISTGLTSIAVTMAVVIVVFDKNYYIVFSIKDVLNNSKFFEVISCTIGSCVTVCIMTMTLLDKQIVSYFDIIRFMILEVAMLYDVIGIIYIVHICINIMFAERKSELSLLRKLYHRFWIYRLDTMNLREKEWTCEAVEINIEYLLERYLTICKKKKIGTIKQIEFSTTIGRCSKKKWYYKGLIKLAIVMMGLFVFSFLVCAITLGKEGIKFILVNCIAILIVIFVGFLNSNCFKIVVLRLFSDTWGYYINYKNNKEILIPRVTIRKGNVFAEYIQRMNSLNAFFYIWLNDVKMKEEDIKIQFQDMLKCFEGLEQRSMIVYFPVFTIGYFLYEKEIIILNIKDLYYEYVIKEGKKYLFERMMHSQIFYLTKNFNENIFDYRRRLNEYLCWMQE